MANTLLAILFSTSSANDQTIVFRYPPSAHALPRLARPRPPPELIFEHMDAPYRAASFPDGPSDTYSSIMLSEIDDDLSEYEWQRPTIKRFRSHSFATSTTRSSSRDRRSPVNQRSDHLSSYLGDEVNEYETVLGYNVDLLAQFLCPKSDNCHQKFELIVDDLAFIGHPVCVDDNGNWSFGEESTAESLPEDPSDHVADDGSTSKSTAEAASKGMLQLFHIVFVIDLPDPSSSASGNLNKYFDVIYQSVVFPLTAVLFNEQVLHNYVEKEWDLLMKLKEDGVSNGDLFAHYTQKCLTNSTLACAIEHTYNAIRANSLARVTLNNISLDLQLPPYLDTLLEANVSSDVHSSGHEYDDEIDDAADWGPDLSFGWNLPALTPWKALLLLDVDPLERNRKDDPLYNLNNLNRPGLTLEEREIADGISHFLNHASVFVSLNDMAILLDWDLQSQVYPTVRYLVKRRRAKVVDLVRSSLKSIFALSAQINISMSDLSVEFKNAFPGLPPLPVIFSRLSSSPGNFFETVVGSKEQIPVYQTVVTWLLKRDLIVVLHMRFRLIASPTLKRLVAAAWSEKRNARYLQRIKSKLGERRKSIAETYVASPGLSKNPSPLQSSVVREHSEEAVEVGSEDESLLTPNSQVSQRNWDPQTPSSFRSPALLERSYEPWGPASLLLSEQRRRNRRFSDTSSPKHSGMHTPPPWDREIKRDKLPDEEEESDSESEPDEPDDLEIPSLISNPERATPRERRWLRGMTMNKNPMVAKRFEDIYKHFDGKKTADEILYKVEISRKELREVLHDFSDHITSFLHP